MTIHHDKMAYGKLESCDEEISPEKLKKMVFEANEDEDKDLKDETSNAKRKDEK